MSESSTEDRMSAKSVSGEFRPKTKEDITSNALEVRLIKNVDEVPAVIQSRSALPVALLAFATTTLMLSLVNAGCLGMADPQFIVGPAIAYGGLIQIVACIFDLMSGNTLGASVTGSYGSFWIGLGIFLYPSSGVASHYVLAEDFNNALGVYLLGFTIVTFVLLVSSLKTSVAFVVLMTTLFITFILLTYGALASNSSCTKGGGWLGVVTAVIAFYNAVAGLNTKENSYFSLPVFPLNGSGH